jgi:uncharacterized protein YtpQ (UPF0354 family)
MNRRALILSLPALAASIFIFRSLFKNRSGAEAVSFRDRVVKLVRASHPDVSLEAPAHSPDVIIVKGTQIGLQNLKAKFNESDRSQETLERLVSEHIQLALYYEPSVPDFETARQKLRPQIMPPEYAQQAPIVSFPFGQTLRIGIVLDSDKTYLYVRGEDALRWNKSHQELLDISLSNLDEASRKMEMQSGSNEEAKWVGIETKDGFDAARILIPKFREFLASQLGSPFRFAVPNRDFLICWNVGASKRFSDLTASKIQKDFQTQPYPLSPHVFEVSEDGTITQPD